MYFQDKFAQVFFSLVSALQVQVSLTHLVEDMKIPKALQKGELNPVTKLQMEPFKSLKDRFYNSSYKFKSGKGRDRQEIESPNRMKTGNRKPSKWNRNEEYEKQNGDQLKWLTNQQFTSDIVQQLNNLNNQIKKLKMMWKVIMDLKVEVSQMEKFKSQKKMNSDGEMKNKMKTVKQVNNISYNNQYRIGNIYIINRLLEEKNSSLVDVEILKELTNDKIEELLEEAVNNLSEGGIPLATQSPHQEIDLLEQLQRSFFQMFNQQNVTLKQVEQMSKIVDFVERYHGVVINLTDEWDKGSGERNNNSQDKKYKYKKEREDLGNGKSRKKKSPDCNSFQKKEPNCCFSKTKLKKTGH